MTMSSVEPASSGSVDAAQLLADAEEQIEAWLCELDATWLGILAGARAEADGIVAAAKAHAAEIVAWAETDANAIRAAAAATPAPPASVEANDLAALAAAVEQLRVELSRVVEAAFDALPAVEATAAALRTVDVVEPVDEPAPRRRRRLLARLTRSRA
jgi:cell division septum initiation protein DivIVA